MTPPGASRTSESASLQAGVVSWELDLFGRVRNLESAALQDFLATEAAHTGSELAITAAITRAYVSIATDKEQLALAEATRGSYRETLELFEKRRELGFGSDLDLERARSQVDAADVEVARFTGLVAIGENILAQLLGTELPAELVPVGTADLPAQVDLAPGLPSAVLLKRPDILAAEHRLRARNAQIGVARAAFFPRIALTGLLGKQSAELSDLLDSGSSTWRLGTQIDVPIFRGGSLRAGLEASKVEREIALAEYEQTILVAFREVNDALALSATLERELDAQRRLEDSLTKTLTLSNARYETGIDGYLGVLDAQRSLFRAQQGSLTVLQRSQENRVTLFEVLAGRLRATPRNEVAKENS